MSGEPDVHWHNKYCEAKERIAELERERDEARATAATYRDAWCRSSGHCLPEEAKAAYPLPWEGE